MTRWKITLLTATFLLLAGPSNGQTDSLRRNAAQPIEYEPGHK